MTRAEKVARAQRLRSEGLKLREIGERMGYRVSTISTWINDPDRSKEVARKNSYRGECTSCGARTDGSNGRKKAPTICIDCFNARNEERNRQIEELWEDGAPIWAIAEELDLRKEQVRGRVAQGIATRRLQMHRLGGTASEREERRHQMIAWRREGMTNPQIADRLGTSPESVNQIFQTCKHLGLDVPEATTVRIASTDTLEALWSEGLTLNQIAEYCGYASGRSVMGRISQARKRGCDFPRRKATA